MYFGLAMIAHMGYCLFNCRLPTTIPRLASYLESRFHNKPTAAEEKSGSLKVTLLCIRDSLPLNITCNTAGATNVIEVCVIAVSMSASLMNLIGWQ
jgi:hypothetical protein